MNTKVLTHLRRSGEFVAACGLLEGDHTHNVAKVSCDGCRAAETLRVASLLTGRRYQPSELQLATKALAEAVSLSVPILYPDGLAAEAERLRAQVAALEMDALTGCYRREVGEQLLVRMARHGQPGLLAYLDIDGLKALNDKQGYDVGDEAVRLLGRVLRMSGRARDVIVRWGGDEMVYGFDSFGWRAPLPWQEGSHIERATHIMRRISEEYHRASCGRFSVSFVICELPPIEHNRVDAGVLNLNQVVKRAAAACRQEKDNGRK